MIQLEFKPSPKKALVIILGLFLTSVILEDLELINLYSKNSERGFFYDYQVIIGGLLAFGAGFFVWNAAKTTIDHEKIKTLEDYYIKKASLASAILADFKNIEI